VDSPVREGEKEDLKSQHSWEEGKTEKKHSRRENSRQETPVHCRKKGPRVPTKENKGENTGKEKPKTRGSKTEMMTLEGGGES